MGVGKQGLIIERVTKRSTARGFEGRKGGGGEMDYKYTKKMVFLKSNNGDLGILIFDYVPSTNIYLSISPFLHVL